MGEYQVKKGTITGDMISDFEANNRRTCLFCEAEGMMFLDNYIPNDLPEGFFCSAFKCLECGRMWREIFKFEEIETGG